MTEQLHSRLSAVERESLTNMIRLAEHEKQCAERYEGINDNIRAMKSIIQWFGGALLVGMAGVLTRLLFFPQ